MSAFVVEPTLMRRCVSAILADGEYGSPIVGVFTTPAERIIISEDRNAGTKIGRALYRMNVNAVLSRYPQDTREMYPEAEEYTHCPHSRTMTGAQLADSAKALECLLYQCSEGDVPESDLYKELERALNAVMRTVVHGLPAYQAAEWG